MTDTGSSDRSAVVADAISKLPGLDRLVFGALLRRRWSRDDDFDFDIQLHGAVRVGAEALADLWRSLGIALIFTAIVIAVIGHFGHVHALVIVGVVGAAIGIVCAVLSGARAYAAAKATAGS